MQVSGNGRPPGQVNALGPPVPGRVDQESIMRGLPILQHMYSHQCTVMSTLLFHFQGVWFTATCTGVVLYCGVVKNALHV